MNRKAKVGLVLVGLLVSVLVLAAGSVPPETGFKATFDKALADAGTAYKTAVLKAYRVFETQIKSLIDAAKAAGQDDRVTDMEKMIEDAKQAVKDKGFAVEDAPETVSNVPKTSSETYAKKVFDKVLADVDKVHKAAVLRAYGTLEGKMKPLLAAAQRTGDSARAQALDGVLAEARKVARDAGVQIADTKPVPTQAQFQALMNRTCARCHTKVAVTVADQKEAGWIVPGNPEASKTYTMIGKNKKPGETYHNLKDDEKRLIYDYIKAGAPEN